MKIKNDKFRKARKGNTKIIHLYCAKCNEFLFDYQKDGIGTLLRLYKDRILVNENNDLFPLSSSSIKCHKCANLIAVYYIYKKENREAYRLIKNAYRKQEK